MGPLPSPITSNSAIIHIDRTHHLGSIERFLGAFWEMQGKADGEMGVGEGDGCRGLSGDGDWGRPLSIAPRAPGDPGKRANSPQRPLHRK